MSDGDVTQSQAQPVAARASMPVAMLLQMLFFMTVMVSLTLGLHFYVGARLIRDAGLGEPWAALAWASLWTMYGTIFLGFLGGRLLPRSAAKVFQWLGFVWMGAFGLLLTGLAASDLVLWLVSFATPVQPTWLAWRAVGVVAVVGPALAWGLATARAPAVKRVTVDIKGLHADLDGFKLVQLSDVHIGETLDRRFSERLVEMVSTLDADAVVITGDLVDGSVSRLRDEVAPLGKLASRQGTFFVTGNHEYYSGAESWMAECEKLGMTVLHNSHRVLTRGAGQLVLGGVPDLQGARFSASHRPDAEAAFAGAPDAPRILLAHQPLFARTHKPRGVSLMLSGHTHGGQLFPFMFFVKLQQPVVGGFAVIEGVPTYTSNGTGYWGPPVRVGPRGEVTVVTLRATR
jgi:predicted MPP superfamily phosphohydrolase